MSNLIKVGNNSLGEQNATPDITAFQVDANGLGGIAQSVNMYRGDVNVPINLVTISSRSGLEAALRLLYSSNVQQDIDTWNLEAPTGPLGLGWSIGYEFIAVNNLSTGATNNKQYFLVAEGGSTPLYATKKVDLGGEPAYWLFELEQYQFWDIRYYPDQERWVITKEDGNRFIYGGETVPTNNSAVQFGVRWGNWVGNSTNAIQQSKPYPIAWNLARIETPWGDGFSYVYENDLENVGSLTGYVYTRSSRLKEVIASQSRSIVLIYGDKVNDLEIREYERPHYYRPSPTTNAYQDRYETHYLQRIEVHNASDAVFEPDSLIVRYEFEYELVNMSIDHVGNPDFYKRYLTKINTYSASGIAQPNFEFEYHNDPKVDLKPDIHRGALKTIRYPQGGGVTYQYARPTLSGTELSSEVSIKDKPRVWFGSDYCVLIEYPANESQMTIRVLSWNGAWREVENPFVFSFAFDPDSLDVKLDDKVFVVSFLSASNNPNFYILPFHKQNGRYGHWFAPQQPTEMLVSQGTQSLLAAGKNFFVAITSGGYLLAKYWDLRTKEWVDRSSGFNLPSNAEYALAAADDIIALAIHRNNTDSVDVELYYFDYQIFDFKPMSLQRQTYFNVLWDSDNTPSQFWSIGPDNAVATYVTKQSTAAKAFYRVTVQQWDTSFQSRITLDELYDIDAATKLPFGQSITNTSVVGNINHVFRFDGVDWDGDNLTINPNPTTTPRFVYGDDAAIVAGDSGGEIMLFDPYSLKWRAVAQSGKSDIPPTINSNYLSLETNLYYRQSDGDLRLLSYSLPANIIPASFVSRAPHFFAFETQGGTIYIVTLKNGDVQAELRIPGESIYVSAGGAGTNLVGADSFMTYQGSFDNPSRLKIYHYNAVEGTIEGHAKSFLVRELDIEDGYPAKLSQNNQTLMRKMAYYYDCNNMTMTPDAKVTSFGTVTVVYGEGATGDPCDAVPVQCPYGRSIYQFYTDLALSTESVSKCQTRDYFFSYLNGNIKEKSDYDAAGNLVEEVTNRYIIRTCYATPGTPSKRLPLIGGYIKQVAAENRLIVSTMGGSGTSRAVPMIRRVKYSYSWITGLLDADSTTNIDLDGQKEVNRRKVYYAWQVNSQNPSSVYALMRERHIWSPVALSIRFHKVGKGADEPNEFALTTFDLWGEVTDTITPVAPRLTYTALDPQVYDNQQKVPVNFPNWDNDGAATPHWRRLGEVLQRSSYGSVTESSDVDNKVSSVVLDASGVQRIAEFTNARLDEVLYIGFENYEATADVQVSKGDLKNSIFTGDANTGFRSLLLDAGVTFSRTGLTLSEKTYILSYWVKTDAVFAGKAEWQIIQNGQVLESYPVAASPNAWAYQHQVVQLGTKVKLTDPITLACVNNSTQAQILLDDIFFSPLDSISDATVYNPQSADDLAKLSVNGNVQRTFYDSQSRVVGTTDFIGRVTSVTAPYFVRQFDKSTPFVFPQATPNSVLTVQSPSGGQLANFVQGEGWMRQWASESLDTWSVKQGRLYHDTTGRTAITLVGTDSMSNYGTQVSVYLSLDANSKPVLPSGEIGMQLGDQLVVTWTRSSGWVLTLGTDHIKLSGATFATNWLLLAPVDPVTGRTSVFFFANGQLLFSRLNTIAIQGALTLFASDQQISFDGIATIPQPELQLVYLDGSGKTRQAQSFTGSGIVVAETLYDEIGRKAVVTKSGQLAGETFGYRVDFVKDFDPISGVMTGEVATCFPADAGYPYSRSQFSDSAQSMVIRQGIPGREFAIIQDPTGKLINEHITRQAYGTNAQGAFGFLNAKEGSYLITQVIDANGDVSYTVKDLINQTIATIADLGNGNYQVTRFYFDGASRLVKTTLANRTSLEFTYNYIGESIETSTPDSGGAQTIYDQGGNIRFVLNPDQATLPLPQIVYLKYDSLGRLREQGYFSGQWDRDTLTAIALQQPNYPDANQTHTVVITNNYDGDGSDILQLGRLIETTRYDDHGTAAIVRRFRYDPQGNIIANSLVALPYDQNTRTIYYSYDALSRLLQVDYPDASQISKVQYRYDALGQMYQVGTPTESNAFGQFLYDASGALIEADVPLGNGDTLNYRAEYNPPGWMTQLGYYAQNNPVMQQQLNYTQGGYNGAGYFDGKLANVTTQMDTPTTYRYLYDKSSRLLTAENDQDSRLSYGVQQPAEYDENDNLQQVSKGGNSQTYHYNGNDQVEKVTGASNQEIDAFTYTAEGSVESAKRLDITKIQYDPVLKKTAHIDLGSNPPVGKPNTRVSFQYDSASFRTVKQQIDRSNDQELSARLYVRNEDGQSLVEVVRQQGQIEEKTQFVYGANGLTSVYKGNKRYTVLSDHQGSIRRVLNGNGAVVATFDYTPFGVTVTRTGSTEPDIIYYRYTGQEFDSEVGLYNYRARFYDPELGRFYDVDPKWKVGSPYVYVRNNPINAIDPNGEELTLLVAIIIGAIVGAIAGAITYAIVTANSGQSFNFGKFLGYMIVGALAGALGGAAFYGAGVLATAGLAALGVETSTSIASGVVVGAVSGSADGFVNSSVNTIGVNLIEGQDAFEGYGSSVGMGVGIGAGVGGVLGGVTGLANRSSASRLMQPDKILYGDDRALPYSANRGIGAGDHFDARMPGAMNNAGAAMNDDVLAIAGHGRTNATTIRFTPGQPRVNADELIADLTGGGRFNGSGIDLSAVCYPGRSGLARNLADELNVPVRGAWGATRTDQISGRTYAYWNIKTPQILRGVYGTDYIRAPTRTYYPSRLRTAWTQLFGY